MIVREQFEFLPSWAWAALIDLTDVFVSFITLLLTATGVFAWLGLGIDEAWDIVQTILALMIFENPIAILNVDLILPQGLDIFPTYSILNLLVKE